MIQAESYEDKLYAVDNLFPINSTGIKTRKDNLLIDIDKNTLIKRFEDIRNSPAQEAITKYKIKTSAHWDLAEAKALITKNIADSIRTILVQPFDTRYIYYEKFMIERGDHRYDLMRHILQPNLAFITIKKSRSEDTPMDFFCSDILVNIHATSGKELNYVFPLYLYPSAEKTGREDTTAGNGPGGRRANLNSKFIYDLTALFGLRWRSDGRGDLTQDIGPEDVFHYMYACFHGWSYREHYADQLKREAPYLPLTHDLEIFRRLAGYGAELVDLHLLRIPGKQSAGAVGGDGGAAALTTPIVQLVGGSVNLIEEVRYEASQQRIYISRNAYFDGIEPEIWDSRIGSYQVLERWLTARSGRWLSYNDIMHYQRLATALIETSRIMGLIDQHMPAGLLVS